MGHPKNQKEWEQYYHEKGQKDASEGKYDNPFTTLESVLLNGKDKAAQEDAYNKGWRSTKDQKDKS